MTLPYYFSSPSSIDLAAIQAEFGSGGVNPIGLNEYYAGGSYVSAGTVGYPNPNGTETPIPSSGAISFDNFHGAGILTGSVQTISGTWVPLAILPKAQCWLRVNMIGGGGGGGGGDEPGVGGDGGAGVYGQLLIRLPATSSIKYIYASAGAPGGPGRYADDALGGIGGQGRAFQSSTSGVAGGLNTVTGGNGGRAGTAGYSGSGGGGGGSSAIAVYSDDLGWRVLMHVGGGGGGGGTGRNNDPTPGTQVGAAFTDGLSFTVGNGGVGETHNGDGGSGGGGGCPNGIGGTVSVKVANAGDPIYDYDAKSGSYVFNGNYSSDVYAQPNEAGANGGVAGDSRWNSAAGTNGSASVSSVSGATPSPATNTYGKGGAGRSGAAGRNAVGSIAFIGTAGAVSIAWSTVVAQPTLTPPAF